jgi:cell division protein DivIC
MKFIEIIKNSKFFKFFSNIYILITTIFLIWIIFIDSNSLVVNMKLKSQINELENKIKHLQDEINQDQKLISNLKNLDSLEKYGREKHFMKKQNEEIYIIEIED